VIELISIIVLAFALTLIVLGVITTWLERERKRFHGVVLALVGVLVGAGYAFLGSRFSEALFGRLIVKVNLPGLMATALTYTAGVLGGTGMAVGLFLWATSRFRQQVERAMIVFVVAGIAVALVATSLAVILSTP
jgi:hypothetical protein